MGKTFSFHTTIIIIITHTILFSTLSANANVGISEPIFGCNFSKENEYEVECPTKSTGKLSRSKLHNHVFVIVTILGTKSALDYLKKNDNLPLKVTFYQDGKRRDTVDYGINQFQWNRNHKLLELEFKNNGFFTWRTKIMSQKITGNQLELIFEDHRGSRVSPVGYSQSYSAVINFY